jgi:uncharacterized protein
MSTARRSRSSYRSSSSGASTICPFPSSCRPSSRSTAPSPAREYQAASADDDELRTPYVEGDELNLSDWARDAVSLALPDKILCRPDCAGLCQFCGDDLNDRPHEHSSEVPDPRWQALESLRNDP